MAELWGVVVLEAVNRRGHGFPVVRPSKYRHARDVQRYIQQRLWSAALCAVAAAFRLQHRTGCTARRREHAEQSGEEGACTAVELHAQSSARSRSELLHVCDV